MIVTVTLGGMVIIKRITFTLRGDYKYSYCNTRGDFKASHFYTER